MLSSEPARGTGFETALCLHTVLGLAFNFPSLRMHNAMSNSKIAQNYLLNKLLGLINEALLNGKHNYVVLKSL